MNIASKTSCWANGWTNPFVTDGLVAMWDGEWNAGGGVHDPNATVWKDLIGNSDLVMRPTAFFDALGADTNGASKGLTYEIDCSNEIRSTQSYEVCADFRTIGRDVLIVKAGLYIYINTNGGVWCNGTSGNNYMPGVGVVSGGKKVLSCVSESENGIISRFYTNGKDSTIISGRDFWSYNRNKVGIASGYSGGGERSVNAVFHCVRFYNRALTASEIAANYAVDKARFNLQ